MSKLSPLIPELETAFKSGSPEKRVSALRKVTDLFLDEGEGLTEPQIGIFDDVLIHLMRHVEAMPLAQLSTTFASLAHAPIETVRWLSRHDEIAVADPILRLSPRLTDADLLQVVRSRGYGHLLAISSRARVSEVVTDALIKDGDRPVRHALARNNGAVFSQAAYVTLVSKSERDTILCEAMGLRLDVPINLLHELLARATETVRQRLLASAGTEQRLHIEQALGDAAKDIIRKVKVRDFARAEGIVLSWRAARLQTPGRLRADAQGRAGLRQCTAILPAVQHAGHSGKAAQDYRT